MKHCLRQLFALLPLLPLFPLLALSVALTSWTKVHAADLVWPGEKIDTWNGFTRHVFKVDGCNAWVVEPKTPLPGKPWSWCMEFANHNVKEMTAPELLAAGFYHAHIDVGNTFGSPTAVKHFVAFHTALVEKGFAPKVALVGISRGGLYAYRFASENPDKVAVIYGDAPVCDFKSWPAGKGEGKGSSKDWAELLTAYHFTNEAEALAYKGNPIDVLPILAKAKIPLIHVVGDKDDVVPVAENTAIVEQRYRALGGVIEVVHKPNDGHKHGLPDSTPMVKFIMEHSLKQFKKP